MTPTAFRSWRARMGLSLTGAGHVLGKSRRTVASYQSGQYPVDEAVALLCGELERREERLWRRRERTRQKQSDKEQFDG